jgi:hypothetical protein
MSFHETESDPGSSTGLHDDNTQGLDMQELICCHHHSRPIDTAHPDKSMGEWDMYSEGHGSDPDTTRFNHSSSFHTTLPPAPGPSQQQETTPGGTGPGSEWPLLGKGDQGERDVQEWVVKTLCAYQDYCAGGNRGSSSAAFSVEGTQVKVFESPPGYQRDFVMFRMF